MTDNNQYQIIPYTHDYAASMATMWNESDDQWPGTFTEGVPMTAERVKKWQDEINMLLNLIVVRDDGKVVGYGNLRDTPNQTGVSCYVPLLNVHPDHQGKSLCRRMLQQMVDYATEHGYSRMKIATWSGNLKSVPLYKKVGFFWIPYRNVVMENYIPAIRRLPAIQAFFQKVDWYQDYKRELHQKEDEERHPQTGDMKVYINRWAKNGEFVEAVLDREGQSVTGLETNDFAAYAVVEDSYPAQGLCYGITWQVENKLSDSVPVTLKAEGDTAVIIEHDEAFTLAAGEKRTIQGHFSCATGAPPIDLKETWEPLPRPRIHTHLQIGAATFSLGTGVSYRPAVELSLEPDTLSVFPGQRQTALLQLQNRVKRPLSGSIHLQHPSSLSANWHTHSFELEAEGTASISVELVSEAAGAGILTIQATLLDGDETITMKPLETAVLMPPLGGLAATKAGDQLFIENEFFRVTALEKGGRVKVWDKISHRDHMWFREELGPPHHPNECEQKEYDVALELSARQVKATFTVASTRFPGLQCIRQVLLTPSPIIQVQHQLVNNGPDTHTVSVLTRARMLDGYQTNGRSFIPHPDRIVSDIASVYPIQDEDFPYNPEEIHEQWIAYEIDSRIHGFVWTEASAQKVRWSGIDHISSVHTLAPGENVTLPPVYPYCGSGRWVDVRRLWQRLTGHTDEETPHPGHAFEFGLEPTPVLTLTGETAVTLRAHNIRPLPLNGTLTLELPAGWQADGTEFAVENLVKGNDLHAPLKLTQTSTQIGAAEARLNLDVPLFDKRFSVPIIRLGDAAKTVTVHEGEGEDGQPLLTMRNGRCQWLVAPGYHGGIVAWRDETELNHLLTKYPQKDAVFSEFTPFMGGIQPDLPHRDGGEWMGKLYRESFHASSVETPDGRGLPWQGVQVTADLQREAFRGLRAEIAYLTLPGSNVLKVIFRLENQTAVYRQASPNLLSYFQVDGAYDNAVLVTDGMERKRTKSMYWEWHPSCWTAVVNPDTGRAITVITASGRRETFLHDLGPEGGHVWLSEEAQIPPHSHHEMITYLVLADSLAQGKQYAVLSGSS